MQAQLLERYRNDIDIYELYVKKIPSDFRLQDVVNFFGKYAKVKSVRVYDSKEKRQPSATVRFYDFDGMMKVYLKFGQSRFKDQEMYVQASRVTLLICSYCKKVGHWGRQCEQRRQHKGYLSSKNYQKKDLNQSTDKFSKSQSLTESTQYFKGSNFSIENQKQQEQFSQQLQYFCPQLEQAHKYQSDDDQKQVFQYNQFIDKGLKKQEQDDITTYQEQSLNITENQEQLNFVTIDRKKSSISLLNLQETQKIQALWNQGWFQQIPYDIGPFVKIISASKQTAFSL